MAAVLQGPYSADHARGSVSLLSCQRGRLCGLWLCGSLYVICCWGGMGFWGRCVGGACSVPYYFNVKYSDAVSKSYHLIWRGEKKTINCMFLFLFVVLILKAILSVCVCVCIFSLFLLWSLCLLCCLQSLSEWELLERVKEVSAMPRNIQQSSTDLTLLNADLMDMDFTDNLFSSLNQPFAFPNPRELGQSLHCSLNQLLCL